MVALLVFAVPPGTATAPVHMNMCLGSALAGIGHPSPIRPLVQSRITQLACVSDRTSFAQFASTSVPVLHH